MYDRDLVLDILTQISQAAATISKRFEPIKSANDFTDSEWGMEKLDAICMQLIAIGESLKNLDKITDKTLLLKYPQIEWDKIKGMRDIITHHYFDVDVEVIFDVCKNHIEGLAHTVRKIIQDLK
ncbi:DUF86 domain-containing protein [candidate division KSB1 bacterium]|nr:DUF86 domain-containing protein [candidate division KSB1 bacterium]